MASESTWFFGQPSVTNASRGWAATGVGTRAFPGHLAAFLGAMAVCLVGNALARFTERPAQLFILPGLILLVPGSFGFLSLEAFLRGEFLGGHGLAHPSQTKTVRVRDGVVATTDGPFVEARSSSPAPC